MKDRKKKEMAVGIAGIAAAAPILAWAVVRALRRRRRAPAPTNERPDPVELGSLYSFPASDPPSFMSPTTSIG